MTRVKELKVRATTKLAIVTITGFEFWFGTKEQEMMITRSRAGVHADLEGELVHGTLILKVRANSRRAGKIDHEWSWRCHVMVQCFGES